MIDGDPQHDFAGLVRASMRTVERLAADHLDVRCRVVGDVEGAKDGARAGEDCLAGAARLGYRVDADDHQRT